MTAGSMATALELRGGQHVTCHVLTDCWAARSRHGAGSTLTGELKEHRSQQRGKLFSCRLHSQPRRNRAGLTIKSARSCRAECASAVFLEENGALFTLTAKPRKSAGRQVFAGPTSIISQRLHVIISESLFLFQHYFGSSWTLVFTQGTPPGCYVENRFSGQLT